MIRSIIIVSILIIPLLGCNYKELVKENETLKGENTELKSLNTTLDHQLKGTLQEKVALEKNLADLNSMKQVLDSELLNLRGNFEVASNENNGLQARIELLEEQKAALQSTVEELNTIYKTAVSNLTEIKVQHKRIRDALDIADARTSDLTTNMVDLENTNKELIERIQTYETDRIELFKQIANLSTQRDQQTANMITMRNELMKLSQDIESTLSDKHGMEVRLNEVAMKNETLATDISSLNQNIANLLVQFRQLRIAYSNYAKLMQFNVLESKQLGTKKN